MTQPPEITAVLNFASSLKLRTVQFADDEVFVRLGRDADLTVERHKEDGCEPALPDADWLLKIEIRVASGKLPADAGEFAQLLAGALANIVDFIAAPVSQ